MPRFKPYSYEQIKLVPLDLNSVLCHNYFAPYNCVFQNHKFSGVIDFDVCAPASRIWDIAYAVYRFVPLYSNHDVIKHSEISPFSKDIMMY